MQLHINRALGGSAHECRKGSLELLGRGKTIEAALESGLRKLPGNTVIDAIAGGPKGLGPFPRTAGALLAKLTEGSNAA